MTDLKLIRVFGGEVSSLAIAPDNTILTGDTVRRDMTLWSLSGECLRTFTGHTDGVTAIAITPDGKRVLSGSQDETMKWWDLSTGECLRTFLGHERWINSVAIFPDGKRFISASDDNTLKLWDQSGCRRTYVCEGEWVTAVALVCGRQFVSGSAMGTVKLWNCEAECFTHYTTKCVRSFERHEDGGVKALAVTPDQKRVVSGSEDCTLKLWDLETGECVRTFEGHNDWVTSVAIAPNGKWVASTGLDDQIIIFDLETGAILAEEETDHSEASPNNGEWMAIANNGEWMAIATEQGVEIRDLTSLAK